jgi:hypothetical protein
MHQGGLWRGRSHQLQHNGKLFPNKGRKFRTFFGKTFPLTPLSSMSLGVPNLRDKRFAKFRTQVALDSSAGGGRVRTQLQDVQDYGRIDVAVTEQTEARQKIDRLGLTDIWEVDPPLGGLEFFTYVHSDRADLVPGLTSALSAMTEDGT